MKKLVVSIHDVHPSSFQAAQNQVSFCETLGIQRFSILVVPDVHMRNPFESCSGLVRWLRARQEDGDEIVLHGFYHLNDSGITSAKTWFCNRIYCANEAEFLDLDFDTALLRVVRGRQRLMEEGLYPAGFIAPAWLINDEVIQAVFHAGFSYTNTVDSILCASGRAIYSRSLCYSARAAWRRAGSVAWNSLLWRLKHRSEVVRISLHPRDLEVAAFRSQISSILRGVNELGFTPTTYRDLVESRAEQVV